MKNKSFENKTDTQTSLSPYQAARAEAQAVPVSRPARAGDALLRLQRRVGNGAVQRLLVQRQEPEEEEEIQFKRLAQRQGGGEGASASPSTGFDLDDETAGRINRARGGGRPLDTTLQEQMSAALGHDFTNVRVHTSPESHALNRQLSARAFTTGRDIFLRQGAYNPGTRGGQELIAHELSHVVQQSTGRVPGGSSGMTARPAGDPLEREAEALAGRAVSTGYKTSPQPTGGRTQRHGNTEDNLLWTEDSKFGVANSNVAAPTEILALARRSDRLDVQRRVALAKEGPLEDFIELTSIHYAKTQAGEPVELLKDSDLTGMTSADTLYIVGHGAPGEIQKSKSYKYTADDIVNLLFKGPKALKCAIKAIGFTSCYAGLEVTSGGAVVPESSIVEKIKKELEQRKWAGVKVTGARGPSIKSAELGPEFTVVPGKMDKGYDLFRTMQEVLKGIHKPETEAATRLQQVGPQATLVDKAKSVSEGTAAFYRDLVNSLKFPTKDCAAARALGNKTVLTTDEQKLKDYLDKSGSPPLLKQPPMLEYVSTG